MELQETFQTKFYVCFLILLLTSCQSKRDICASWSSEQINNNEAAKKLGIDLDDLDYTYEENKRISSFCIYYRD